MGQRFPTSSSSSNLRESRAFRLGGASRPAANQLALRRLACIPQDELPSQLTRLCVSLMVGWWWGGNSSAWASFDSAEQRASASWFSSNPSSPPDWPVSWLSSNLTPHFDAVSSASLSAIESFDFCISLAYPAHSLSDGEVIWHGVPQGPVGRWCSWCCSPPSPCSGAPIIDRVSVMAAGNVNQGRCCARCHRIHTPVESRRS